jgi:hypothetical protein
MINEHDVSMPVRNDTDRGILALAAVETVALLGALVWGYVAVVAMVYPDRLPVPLVSWIPLRRDALATLAFAVSVIAFFTSQRRRTTLPVVWGRTLFTYSAMVSVYLMGNSITHPATMDLPLTHLVSWPLERTVLCGSLVCLVLSFFVLRVLRQRAGDARIPTHRC